MGVPDQGRGRRPHVLPLLQRAASRSQGRSQGGPRQARQEVSGRFLSCVIRRGRPPPRAGLDGSPARPMSHPCTSPEASLEFRCIRGLGGRSGADAIILVFENGTSKPLDARAVFDHDPRIGVSPALRRKGGAGRWRHRQPVSYRLTKPLARGHARDRPTALPSPASSSIDRLSLTSQTRDRLRGLARKILGSLGEWKGFPNRSVIPELALRVRSFDPDPARLPSIRLHENPAGALIPAEGRAPGGRSRGSVGAIALATRITHLL